MPARRLPVTTEEFRLLESEAAFQSWVVDYARSRSWCVAHVRDSRRQDTDGMPDLVLARGGVVILAELKSATGKTTPKQDAWLQASGNNLWMPGDRAKVERMLE